MTPKQILDSFSETLMRDERILSAPERALVASLLQHAKAATGNPETQEAVRAVVASAVGETVAKEVEARTGMQTRATVLGYIQRGGSPTARDRILGLRFGLEAADLVQQGKWGRMAALHGDEVVSVPLTEATAELKLVPQSWYDTATTFFG